jgi:hypothetical protein
MPTSGRAAESAAKPPARLRRTAPGWLRLLLLAALGLGLAFPLARALLEGSFSGERQAAADAAESFLTAVHEGQQNQISALVIADASAGPWLGWHGFTQLSSPFLSFQCGNVSIQNENALVAFTLHFHEEPDQVRQFAVPPGVLGEEVLRTQRQSAREMDGWKGAVQLRRVGAAWKVSGFAPASEDGKSPVVGFQPIRSVAVDAQPFEDWAGVDAQQFATSWQTDLEVQDRPAKDVLTDLAGQLGLLLLPSMDSTGLPRPPAPLDKPVTLHVHSRSRFEAIEEACRQLGMYPQYQVGVQVRPGPRPWPAAFAGPFLVEVAGVKEFPPAPTGTLTLKCFAAGLPAPVADLLSGDDEAFLPTRISAADGSDLYRTDYPGSAPSPGVPPGFAGRQYQRQLNVPLKNLLRDLDVIHEVRGRVRVILPAKVLAVRFDPLVSGTVRQTGGVSLTLRRPVATPPGQTGALGLPAQRLDPTRTGQSGMQAVLEFETEGTDGLPLRWMAYDRSGAALRGDRARPAPNGLVRLEVPSDTAAVVLKVVTEKREVVYPFELHEVPLQRAPRHIEAPQFPRHAAPVEIELVRMISPSGGANPATLGAPTAVEVRIRNFSQKDVEHVRMRFTYFDAAGGRLKEAMREGLKSPRFVPGPAILVNANSEDAITVDDPDRPEGTSRITVTPVVVGFTDGTTWSP